MTKTEREDDGTLLENEVVYREFGASENDPLVRLTYDEVYRVVAQKAKSGYLPQERDIRLFMKLCKSCRIPAFTDDERLRRE